MGGMLATMRWKKRSLPLNVSALKHSTSSPSSSTVVWREVLCSPSSAAGSRPVRVDADICCSLDDEEVDVWAAVIVGSEVGVACVVPLVVCLCLSTGDVASGVALSDCLRGVDEERPDSSLSSILLIRCVAALRAEVVRDELGSSVADATLRVVVFDAELFVMSWTGKVILQCPQKYSAALLMSLLQLLQITQGVAQMWSGGAVVMFLHSLVVVDFFDGFERGGRLLPGS